MSTFACTSAATSSSRPSPAAPAAGLLRRPGRPADQGARATRLRADLRPRRRRPGVRFQPDRQGLLRLGAVLDLVGLQPGLMCEASGRTDAHRRAAATGGVPVPTIKYCLREGLPRPGELTSPDQAQYDESHLRKLRLMRALAEVGGLSIAASESPGTSLTTRPARHSTPRPPGTGTPPVTRPAGRRPPRPASSSAAAAGGSSRTPGPGTAHRRPGRPARPGPGPTCSPLPTPTPGPQGTSPPPTWPRSTDGGAWTASSKGIIFGAALDDILLAALRRLAGEYTSAPFRKRPPPRHRETAGLPRLASRPARGSPSRVRISHPIPDRQNR
jgi:MerR-like DNA binding protein